MQKWVVTGASGSLATACISELLNKGIEVHAFSRSKIKNNKEKVVFTQVKDYDNLKFNFNDFEGILITQGFFHYEIFESTSHENLTKLIEANFISQILTVKSFLNRMDLNRKINIVIIGSTSAFMAGTGTVIYGAAKAGILAFVRALNNEYVDTDVRFWFVSTGTIANRMGSMVPNQDPDSLLDVNLVAREIIEKVTITSNLWQPEITIRRRHIRTLD